MPPITSSAASRVPSRRSSLVARCYALGWSEREHPSRANSSTRRAANSSTPGAAAPLWVVPSERCGRRACGSRCKKSPLVRDETNTVVFAVDEQHRLRIRSDLAARPALGTSDRAGLSRRRRGRTEFASMTSSHPRGSVRARGQKCISASAHSSREDLRQANAGARYGHRFHASKSSVQSASNSARVRSGNRDAYRIATKPPSE